MLLVPRAAIERNLSGTAKNAPIAKWTASDSVNMVPRRFSVWRSVRQAMQLLFLDLVSFHAARATRARCRNEHMVGRETYVNVIEVVEMGVTPAHMQEGRVNIQDSGKGVAQLCGNRSNGKHAATYEHAAVVEWTYTVT
jgi:hypothetical protein